MRVNIPTSQRDAWGRRGLLSPGDVVGRLKSYIVVVIMKIRNFYMKKIFAGSLTVVTFLLPTISFAAVNSINGQSGAAQTLATTSAATTTMHMKIVSSGNTHTFKWDNSPWTVDQGGTGAKVFRPVHFFTETEPSALSGATYFPPPSFRSSINATSTTCNFEVISGNMEVKERNICGGDSHVVTPDVYPYSLIVDCRLCHC